MRAVRTYTETLEEFSQINAKLDDNVAQLDKARQNVSQVIWYYNNQQLSSRALEKQDPDQFNQWFTKAKEEWNSFPNKSWRSFPCSRPTPQHCFGTNI